MNISDNMLQTPTFTQDQASKNNSNSSCSFSHLGHNVTVGTTVGVGAGAGPCVFSTGGYPACVGLAALGGAAGGAFQTAVECTLEKLSGQIAN